LAVRDHNAGPNLYDDGISLRHFERVAQQVLTLVSRASYARTRDVVEITYAEGGETFIVLLTPEAIEFRMPTIEWSGPATQVSSSTPWKRVVLAKLDEADLPALIAGVREAYAKTIRTCHYCKEKFPPGHMLNDNTCHGCASKYEGVVY
jgi:hypothetical protein